MSQLGFDDLRERVVSFAAAAKESAAFAHVCPDVELARIDQAERRGDHRMLEGDLAGWIIPAKDLHDVAGMPTTHGSLPSGAVAAATDPFIARYMDRGALVVAKTQTSEYGLSAYCEPADAPAPTWNEHTPGGSSGGAAVAVASGTVRAAHATDGGGSIRVPAAATGTIGFKPTHNTTGANPVAHGFITRTVNDQAILHRITPRITRPLKVGVLTEPLHAKTKVDPATINVAISNVALLIATQQVTELSVPYGPEHFRAFETVIKSRAARIVDPATPLVRWLRDEGRAIGAGELAWARRVFAATRGVVERAWDVDVVVMPTLSHEPPRVRHFSSMDPHSDFVAQTKWTPWATLFNLTGHAAVTVPVCGVGVQLGAIRASEAELLAVAAMVENRSEYDAG